MNTILISSTEIIDSLEIKYKKLVPAPGELKIEIYPKEKRGKKNNIIIIHANHDLVKTKVGLRWINSKFPKINEIINIGKVIPVNQMILKNHILIPNQILSLYDSPIEWNRGIKIPSIIINQLNQNILREAIYENNLDFIYGDVLSINPIHENERILKELKSSKICDGVNNLVYTVNEFAEINKIPIFNILIGSPDKYILNKKLNINLIIDHILNQLYK